MILYVTKKTKERLNIPMIDELSDISKNYASIVLNNEENIELLKWGIKIFYMDRRKCLQAVNFASKLTIYSLLPLILTVNKLSKLTSLFISIVFNVLFSM